MSDNEPRCTTCGLPTHPDYGDPHECPAGFLTDSPSVPTTQGEREPRVARNVDELRVGQDIVWTAYDHEDWVWLRVTQETLDPFHWQDVDFAAGHVVILSDAPSRGAE